MRINRTLVIAVAGGIALVAAACGGDDDTSGSAGGGDGDTRTVEIAMVDRPAFEPEELEVEQGETVRFVFTNQGEALHDAFIGDRDAQHDHEAEMRENEGDEHGHGDEEEAEDAITVDPGDTGELTYTFDESGTVEIGCHQPGHYEAGMKVTVEVA